MTTPASALRLHRVRIALGERVLIDDFNVKVAAGVCTTVMGASGSGKSTLLAYLSGTLAPAFTAGGEVFIGDVEVTRLPPERRGIGILFQDDLLFPHMSVGTNLAFALPAEVKGRAARDIQVADALREAGLSGFEARDPATLSGGQRARVALMRTLLAHPRALLLDEPFNKLDARLRSDFRAFVFEHARERRLPILLVTHDEQDARAAGGPLIELGGTA
ncbi:MAG TPA: ATP-binding cassette domain-containing protein [Burkholderiaceae bacterium]|nr:ATP-binding cassette domain-containing protein [Burkholderiaceae bacterium]